MKDFIFNIARTRALIIGVGNYDHMSSILPAITNVEDIEKLLLDPQIAGLAPHHIVPIKDADNDEIAEAIVAFLKHPDNNEVENLILYYTGHGVRDLRTNRYYLMAKNSRTETLTTSAIEFDYIKNLIESSQIQKRFVILDACYSGAAAMGGEGELYSAKELDIKGTYILTSTSATEQAFFDDKERNTFFTEAFITVLKEGSRSDQPYLSLHDVYNSLLYYDKKTLLPQHKSNLTLDVELFKNLKYNRYAVLEKEADKFYEAGNYTEALVSYYQLRDDKPGPELEEKIKRALERRDLVKQLSAPQPAKAPLISQQPVTPPDASEIKVSNNPTKPVGNAPKNEDEFWQLTKETDTVEGYIAFLKAFPNSRYKSLAESRLSGAKAKFALAQAKLAEQAWIEAVRINTIDSYLNFIRRFGDSKFTDQAIEYYDRLEGTGQPTRKYQQPWHYEFYMRLNTLRDNIWEGLGNIFGNVTGFFGFIWGLGAFPLIMITVFITTLCFVIYTSQPAQRWVHGPKVAVFASHTSARKNNQILSIDTIVRDDINKHLIFLVHKLANVPLYRTQINARFLNEYIDEQAYSTNENELFTKTGLIGKDAAFAGDSGLIIVPWTASVGAFKCVEYELTTSEYNPNISNPYREVQNYKDTLCFK